MARADELPALAPEVEAFLSDNNVDDETRYMCRKYYADWGKPSTHLDGQLLNSWAALLIHARGSEAARVSNARLEERELRNAKRRRQAENAEHSSEWVTWHRLCTERKARIEVASAEWRTRVAQRNKWMAESQLYVEEARVAMQNAKLEPVPVQPGK